MRPVRRNIRPLEVITRDRMIKVRARTPGLLEDPEIPGQFRQRIRNQGWAKGSDARPPNGRQDANGLLHV